MTELLDRRFPADLSRMGEMRGEIREGMKHEGVPDVLSDNLILVVDEIVSNAIEHGVEYRNSDHPIRIQVSKSEEGLVLAVSDVDVPNELIADLAKEFEQRDQNVSDSLMERGRGMFLITMLLAELRVSQADGGGMRLWGRLRESRY